MGYNNWWNKYEIDARILEAVKVEHDLEVIVHEDSKME